MEKLTFGQAQLLILEINSIIPLLNDFYLGKLEGAELHSKLLTQTPHHQEIYQESFLEFINQINKPLFFGSWTLPEHSSGSFFTAVVNIDYLYEQDFSQEQITLLRKMATIN